MGVFCCCCCCCSWQDRPRAPSPRGNRYKSRACPPLVKMAAISMDDQRTGGWLVVVVVVVVVVECARPEQPGARVLSQPTRGVFVVVVVVVVLVVVAQANRSDICFQTTTGVVLLFLFCVVAHRRERQHVSLGGVARSWCSGVYSVFCLFSEAAGVAFQHPFSAV